MSGWSGCTGTIDAGPARADWAKPHEQAHGREARGRRTVIGEQAAGNRRRAIAAAAGYSPDSSRRRFSNSSL